MLINNKVFTREIRGKESNKVPINKEAKESVNSGKCMLTRELLRRVLIVEI